MNLRAKRFLLAIIVGLITLTSLLLLEILDENIYFGELTPFWIFVLFGCFCLWIFLIYISLGLRKSKEYLQKVEKWDSPKAVGLMLILLWAFYGILYYIKPYMWFFFLAICFSTGIISAVYMRNAYRKQIDLEP